MKNVVIAVIALALIAVAFLLGRRSVKPEIVEIHRTDTMWMRDTVRETVLVPEVRYLTRVDTVLLKVPGRRVRLPRVARYTRHLPKNADRDEYGRPAGRGSRQAQALGNRRERRVCPHAKGYETVYWSWSSIQFSVLVNLLGITFLQKLANSWQKFSSIFIIYYFSINYNDRFKVS